MKRGQCLILIVSLMVILAVVVACGPAPTPAPPAPTPAPSPAPKPGPHPRVDIQIYTTPQGSTNYVLAWGFCDLAEKTSEWLRGTVEVAPGDAMFKLVNKEPERKKTYVGMNIPANEWTAVNELGIKDMTQRPLTKVNDTHAVLATLNPNIKTPQDLKGKRIALAGRPGSGLYEQVRVLLQALGVWDEKLIEPGTFDSAKTALLDGTVDVAELAGSGQGKIWALTPAGTEAVASGRDIYIISFAEETFAKARASTGYPITLSRIPPELYGPKQSKTVIGIGFPNSYLAVAEMDDDVAYEIVRIMWDNIDKFKEYHKSGAMLGREFMPTSPYPESRFHPGAVKFFKEKGVTKIGTGS